MEIKESIKKYFESLSNGDYEKLMKLFDSDSVVFSPLYGKISAKDFYRQLIDDSEENSSVVLLHAFVDEKTKKGAGNFRYDWTLKNGSNSSFEGVDLFEFNKDRKIKQVKIIYDTFGIREGFYKMKGKKEVA